VPIAATTANISDATSTASAGPAITPAEVQQFVTEAQLDIAYCIDGGTCPLANHMTIVDCSADATIVRDGVVSRTRGMAAIGAIPAQTATQRAER